MSDSQFSNSAGHWKGILFCAILVGLLFIAAYSWDVEDPDRPLAIMSVGALLAGACLFTGGLIGFLFGIPRTLQRPADDSQQGTEYQDNTNLELISDWLTKILVGVGLTQIEEIPTFFLNIANFFAGAVGGDPVGAPFAVSVMIYFLTCGFFYGYLWTRLLLKGELRKSDQLGVLESRVEKGEAQDKIDAHATEQFERFFYPDPQDPNPVPPERLKEDIGNASESVRTRIFFKALQIRRENSPYNLKALEQLVTPNHRQMMVRTIPVFEALIEADKEDKYHQNHGQLGYALRDLGENKRDWARAKKELDQAIKIRDAQKETGWSWYEVNRAACVIFLDEKFQSKQPTALEAKERILKDLLSAPDEFKQVYKNDEVIQGWMKLNKVTVKSLTTAAD